MSTAETYLKQINHWRKEAAKWKAEYHDALRIISDLRRETANSEQRQAARSSFGNSVVNGRF